MGANLTPEERSRLQVQVRKARRLQADETRRQALAERKAELAAARGSWRCLLTAAKRAVRQPLRWPADLGPRSSGGARGPRMPGDQGDAGRRGAPRHAGGGREHGALRAPRLPDRSRGGHRRRRSERVAESRGDSMRTVSGGAFESNRRRH